MAPPTQSQIDSINSKLQRDLAGLVTVTSGNAYDNIKPWLDAVAADLKDGNLAGAKHLLQTIILAIPDET